MPRMGGHALAREIRRRERPGGGRLPILALTANALAGEADAVRDSGMDEYLTKPLRLAALGAALKRWVAEPGSSSLSGYLGR